MRVFRGLESVVIRIQTPVMKVGSDSVQAKAGSTETNLAKDIDAMSTLLKKGMFSAGAPSTFPRHAVGSCRGSIPSVSSPD